MANVIDPPPPPPPPPDTDYQALIDALSQRLDRHVVEIVELKAIWDRIKAVLP